ncbi:hypothetical protein LTR28_005962 [Elasticomyces elasticus]|nr:hypothetical protein LTR28_005962 [Elasticomyces elasticus]
MWFSPGLLEQRETQAREVKELREQQEYAQKKAAEVVEEAAKATKELKDQIENLKEDVKALSSGQVSPERTQTGQGESNPRSHPTSAWPSLPTLTAGRPSTVSHISSTGTIRRRPADEEKRIVNIDARRARCEKKDIAKVKDKLERALRAYGATNGARTEFIRTLSGDRIEVCFEIEEKCKQARQNP